MCTGSGACSAVHYFKTAGAGEFSFIWISDFHAYPPLSGRLTRAVRVMNEARAIDPSVDFIFSTGDTIAWGGSYSFWTNMYAQDFIRDYMFANLLGNHDYMTRSYTYSSDYFKVVNDLPLNGYSGQEGVCYWFIYNNVMFITLNNEVMSGNAAAEAAAKAWAGGVIQSLAGQYEYVILAEHYQWFYAQDGRTSWYANWKGFCDQYGVDLALSGNNHIYLRTYPLYNDQVVSNGQGTVYMQAPSSDGERGVEGGTITSNTEKIAYTYSSHTISGGSQVKTIGCVLVKVNAQGITTKLVYLDDSLAPHVADENTIGDNTEPAQQGRFDAIRQLPAGGVELEMSGTPDANYILEWTGDWLGWSDLCTLSASNGLFGWVDFAVSNSAPRFYRLRAEGPPPPIPGSKPAVFRNATAMFHLRYSNTTGSPENSFYFGATGDLPVMGDWDGDGVKTPGVFRDGQWFLRNSNSGGPVDITLSYGAAGDIPVVGDWDGNGTDTPGFDRDSQWFLSNDFAGNTAHNFWFGIPGDVPLAGDWTGNGGDWVGVFRPSNATFYLGENGGPTTSFIYGNPSDVPIVGDWDNDGSDTVGVVRGVSRYLRNSNTAGVADVSFDFGNSGDIQLVWK